MTLSGRNRTQRQPFASGEREGATVTVRTALDVTKEVLREYQKDKVPKLAASLSYLTVFSMTPLLLISIAVAGLVFGPEAAQGRIVQEIGGLVGREGAQLIETLVKNTYADRTGPIATLLAVITIFISATAAFADLQDSLNMVFGVKADATGSAVLRLLWRRLVSFGLVLATGFLLLVSLVLSTAITALNDYLGASLSWPAFILEIANLVITFGIITVLFALMFKLLPDARLTWKAVRVGALFTAALFMVGKSLIGLYLGRSATASTFGAAGSLAVLLLWIYYSAQTFFLGAEFTDVYARRYGPGVPPAPEAHKAKTRMRKYAES
jgi:membrane protein